MSEKSSIKEWNNLLSNVAEWDKKGAQRVMQLNALQDRTEVTYREATRDNRDRSAPDWNDYGGDANGWKRGTLFIAMRRYRTQNPLTLIILESNTQLEFSPDDCSNEGDNLHVCVENYHIEIQGVNV